MGSSLTPVTRNNLELAKKGSALRSLEDAFSRTLDFAPHLTLTTFSNENIEIAAATLPNPELSKGNLEYVDSGDFYDIIPFSQNRTGLIIADSSKSGKEGLIHARDICTQFRNYLANESTKNPKQRHCMDPSSSLQLLSKKNVDDGGSFCSLLYVDVMITDIGKGKISIYSAGHNFPILYSPQHGLDKKEYEYPKTFGVAIGWEVDEPRYPAHTFTIEKGDYIVLFTDGATEARINKKDELERSGLVSFIDNLVKAGVTEPRKIVNACLSIITSWNKNEYHSDDISLMVTQIK